MNGHNGRLGLMVALVLLVALMFGGLAQAAWRTTAWTYQASDLFGAGCLQNAVDDLDGSRDSLTNGTAIPGCIVTGTCTNGQIVVFSIPFAAAPYVAIQQNVATNVCYASAVTSNGFTAVVGGAAITTNAWLAIGTK